ncbi:MAG: 5'-methylthioadenosine/adenosylhomocysteine nucleosidase [Clostridiales bacterium]|nr:5'-methylthioadenosine/adenosylhomocysteine nucleosidase [Clostridiales bacterium]
MKVGIIGALDFEVSALSALMTSHEVKTVSMVKYHTGTINDVPVVVAAAGVGKVNAAVCTQTMILKYNPDIVINVGVAGALEDELSIGDIAVAVSVAEHDMDTTPVGDEKGFISGIDRVYMDCDDEMTQLMYEAASKLDVKVIKGIIASGDQFIASREQRERIKREFGAVAAEMEGASIGHVCTMSNKPFAVLRAISDSADDESKTDFPTFARAAAKNSVQVILYMLKNLNRGDDDE